MWTRLSAVCPPHLRLAQYSTGPGGGLRAGAIQAREGQMHYDLFWGEKQVGSYTLGAPGRHNVSNALAAISACCIAVIGSNGPTFQRSLHRAATALQDFYGVARRFQRCGEAKGIIVYDDYAHHPTEVRSTLETARDFLNRPLTVIFQPHRYSRTQQMGHEFGPAFAAADQVIITQLYSAFEEPIPGVSGRIVYDAVRGCFPDKPIYYVETLDKARHLAIELTRPGAAIITMGAGDISCLPALLLQELDSTS